MVYSAAASADLLAPFWEAAAKRRLVLQRCARCSVIRFPPTAICPECLSHDQRWIEASGNCTLESIVEFHQRYWAEPEEMPYVVGLVRLSEGPLMLARLAGLGYDTDIGRQLVVIFGPGRNGQEVPLLAARDISGAL